MDVYCREKKRLNRQQLHLKFLTDCKRAGVCPKFLNVKVRKHSDAYLDVLRTTEQKLLTKEIDFLKNSILKLNRFLCNLKLKLSNSISPVIFNYELNKLETFIQKETINIVNRHRKKFNFLVNSQLGLNSDNFAVPFLNLSSYNFSSSEVEILQKGPKYIPGFYPSKENLMFKLEQIIQNLPANVQEYYRAKLMTKLNFKSSPQLRKERKILYELKNNPNFVILEADKAKQIVILNTVDFQLKINEVLNELNVTQLKSDPTLKILRKINELKKHPDLPTSIKNGCEPPFYPQAPLLFFKIKTHKPNLPLRALVSKRTSPTYNLEIALLNFLTPFFPPSQFSVKSSTNVVEKLKFLPLTKTDKLFSFDVVSLFSNIPLKEAIDIILNDLRQYHNDKQIIAIEQALSLVLFNNYFKINNNFYIQKVGCPMGSPLSPFVAEIILKHIEEKIVKFYPFPPTLYCRYVDDILVIWRYSKNELYNFLKILNSQFKTIKFTLEEENEAKLPFLDLLLIRTSNLEIAYDIYRKPNFIPLPIPEKAIAPFRFKKSFFNFYFRRAILCTSNKFFERREINFIFELGKRAGYTGAVINKIFKEVLFYLYNPRKKESNKKFFSIPFVPSLQGELKKLSKRFNFNYTFKTQPNLLKLIKRDRDINPPVGGVYRIPLVNDKKELKYYIGMTKRTLNVRLKEHKYNLRTGNFNSVLVDNIINNNLIPLWDSTEILAAPTTFTELRFRETVEIEKCIRNKNCINVPTYDIPPLCKSMLCN